MVDSIPDWDVRVPTIREHKIPTANSGPYICVEGPDGELWFCEKAGNKIGRITPAGVITEFEVPTPKAGPDGIMLGPDGNVWFSETDVSQIGRITPAGEITEFREGITAGAKPLSIVVR